MTNLKKVTNPAAWKDYIAYAEYTIRRFKAVQTEYDAVYFVRELSIAIFDMKAKLSGYVSKEHADKIKAELVWEHYFSRKKSAVLIYNLLKNRKNITAKRIAAVMMSRNRVHLVSKEENQLLRKYQHSSNNYKTWREEYAAAGIKLVPYIPKKVGRKTSEIL